MRRRSSSRIPILIVLVAVILLVIWIISFFSGIGEQDPKDVVKEFYQSEQEGDFGSAWELFHPMMQERFSKNAYVTERSHIYMSHLGVETFSFELSEEEEVQNWKMNKDTEKFPEAYRVEVEQTFKSKFGTFTIIQDIYAVKVEDEWRIVWDFN
ncbi:MAG: DUF4878 domain-containing protein [Bacillota bacterium]